MDPCRATIASVLLAGATLLGAILGPPLGSPDPAVMIAILFSALTSSIAGFAFSAICGGILFHLWDDHVRIVAIMIACSTANQAVMVWSLRREIRWADLPLYLAGGVLGVPVGAWALLHADRERFAQAVGLLLLAYGAWTAFGSRRVLRLEHPVANAVVGFLGGVTGAAAAMPSLPLTIWCRLQGWDKDTQRALYQPFILLIQIAALLAILLLAGVRGSGFEAPDLLCIPAGLFGTHVGMGCYRGLSNRQFALAVNILVIASGLSFMV